MLLFFYKVPFFDVVNLSFSPLLNNVNKLNIKKSFLHIELSYYERQTNRQNKLHTKCSLAQGIFTANFSRITQLEADMSRFKLFQIDISDYRVISLLKSLNNSNQNKTKMRIPRLILPLISFLKFRQNS